MYGEPGSPKQDCVRGPGSPKEDCVRGPKEDGDVREPGNPKDNGESVWEPGSLKESGEAVWEPGSLKENGEAAQGPGSPKEAGSICKRSWCFRQTMVIDEEEDVAQSANVSLTKICAGSAISMQE